MLSTTSGPFPDAQNLSLRGLPLLLGVEILTRPMQGESASYGAAYGGWGRVS